MSRLSLDALALFVVAAFLALIVAVAVYLWPFFLGAAFTLGMFYALAWALARVDSMYKGGE